MMQYEVTIGIPVFQAVDYIGDTLLSALNQTYFSIEFLILDDCGGDGSMDVVNRIKAEHPRGKDIHILYHQTNRGVGVARNHILDEAKGRYLYFLDSDDLLEPDAIQLLANKMHEYHAEIVYGSLDRIDKVGHTATKSFLLPDSCLLSENEMALYAFKNYRTFQISICNCLMDMNFIRGQHLRFLDTVFWEDLAFTYEMVTKVSRAVLVSDVTYHYLCRPGSLSHYQDREQLEKSEILKNIQTIDYLKEKSRNLMSKPYLSYYCKDIEMNSFYIVCHILKHSHRIVPNFTYQEMRAILSHPLSLNKILSFRQKILPNLLLWLLGILPVPLFIPSIWLMGKFKKAI